MDAIAARYSNPVTGGALSGEALLAKLLQGESSALSDSADAGGRVSSAGARAWGQFMPDSRKTVIAKYGLDPWASIDQAVHATALHLRGRINGSTGLEGYNPGDPSYTSYILNQKVGSLGGGGSSSGGSVGDATSPIARAATSRQGPSLADQVGEVPDLAGLLAQVQTSSRPAVVSSGVAAPSFAAAPALPSGYQAAVSSGGGSGGTSSDNLASLLQTVSAMGPQPVADGSTSSDTAAQASTQASPRTGVPGGSLTGRPITDVKRLFARAAAIDSQHLPYVYGGGHSARTSRPGTPLDCSAAVSKVLGIDPRVSGDFQSFGSPGADRTGKGVTIYANKGHVLMEIDGHFWGTSHANPNGGAGWIPKSQISASYLKGFTARHLASAS